MKENRFSEKESLELISQMLKQTRQNLETGSGNLFLYYGYVVLLLAVFIFALICFTDNAIWSYLWLLLFAAYFIEIIRNSRRKPHAVTYMDKAIKNTWAVIGRLFILTLCAILLIGNYVGIRINLDMQMTLMFPLSLLYAAIGTFITGVIINMRVMIYMPVISFFISMYMLIELISQGVPTVFWHLYFGAVFVFAMIIPGHLLNRKSDQLCRKN